MHERHLGPVAVQTKHVEEARSNKDFRASVNHGRPPVAATARPADFKGETTPGRDGNEQRTYNHVKDVPPMERPIAPNSGNAKMDQKYQKEQDKLYQQQAKERQKVQQQQEREDQKAAKQANNTARQQQVEQRHQQQTQQMVQRHQNQVQAMRQRQAPAERGGGGAPRR